VPASRPKHGPMRAPACRAVPLGTTARQQRSEERRQRSGRPGRRWWPGSKGGTDDCGGGLRGGRRRTTQCREEGRLDNGAGALRGGQRRPMQAAAAATGGRTTEAAGDDLRSSCRGRRRPVQVAGQEAGRRRRTKTVQVHTVGAAAAHEGGEWRECAAGAEAAPRVKREEGVKKGDRVRWVD